MIVLIKSLMIVEAELNIEPDVSIKCSFHCRHLPEIGDIKGS